MQKNEVAPKCWLSVKNEYIDQHLECAAPKHWSKYSTVVSEVVHGAICYPS